MTALPDSAQKGLTVAHRKDALLSGGKFVLPWTPRFARIFEHVTAYAERNRVIEPTGYGFNRSVVTRLAIADWLDAIAEGEPLAPESIQAESEEYAAMTQFGSDRADLYFNLEGLQQIDRLTFLIEQSPLRMVIRTVTQTKKATKLSQGMIATLAVLRYARRRVGLTLGLPDIPPVE